MFERYTESARRALFFARYEVTRVGGSAIETEHLLLGLIRNRAGIGGRILESAQLSADQLRAELSARPDAHTKVPTSVEVPFSPETRRALESAVEEADRLAHSYIGTEHLLLGLLRDESSVAGTVLATHGLRLEGVRETVAKMLEQSASPGAPAPARGGLSTRIDQIRQSVDQLAGLLPDGTEERRLADSIRESLDRLKRHIAG